MSSYTSNLGAEAILQCRGLTEPIALKINFLSCIEVRIVRVYDYEIIGALST
jgi:hypothetical protein